MSPPEKPFSGRSLPGRGSSPPQPATSMNRSRKPRIIDPSRAKAMLASCGCGSISAAPSGVTSCRSQDAGLVFHGFQPLVWPGTFRPARTSPRSAVSGWVSTVVNRVPS
ncbi:MULTISPECIES: hypothetical protein [Saccharothrix]|uniref:hypothetical protein n=1 Tax=Saccharothrix TaxID=2071 RepID=UPI001F52462C|nr:hypothetical protein [Saccharothrix sp. CB00851]